MRNVTQSKKETIIYYLTLIGKVQEKLGKILKKMT